MRLVESKEKQLPLPEHKLAENLILLFWFLRIYKIGINANFKISFKDFLLRSFSYQNVSQIVNKIFAVHCFFANHLKHTTVNKNNLQSALSKSLPTICTLSEQLSNRYNYFLRLTVFPDLFVKVFLINFNFF